MTPKFRAWHKDKKLMLNVIAINFELLQITADIENKKIYPDLDYWWKETDIPFSEIELMQSTGLKDKNGKEVYEGDILKTWIGGYEQASPYVVEDMRKLYFELKRDDSYYRIQKTEILGNIYENQELIEVECN